MSRTKLHKNRWQGTEVFEMFLIYCISLVTYIHVPMPETPIANPSTYTSVSRYFSRRCVICPKMPKKTQTPVLAVVKGAIPQAVAPSQGTSGEGNHGASNLRRRPCHKEREAEHNQTRLKKLLKHWPTVCEQTAQRNLGARPNGPIANVRGPKREK
ncbi:uncharacterized protein EI97DRAFT_260762 [Westerdykella ornata]|uniref:Uncharacterized protein n=1 Tax=Westerdykella ornata TaxID=318751 RepID=A0A6A6J6Q6_WESOR|nr:uncharacterized protein EI97DRAFT_260762 [Westerdykella ornata]KAF2271658.1 hypothetical protein EI97DRAFT_260762 [Westerdykella ornata]